MVDIVTAAVSQQVAPLPNTLQQTGAFVSQGATILAPGASGLLTQLSDLAAIISGSQLLASLSWSTGVVSATTVSPHGLEIGQSIWLTIVGATPAGYNGTFLATISSGNQFTYAMPLSLATATAPGAYSLEDIAELNAMAITYFGQPNVPAVFVLEVGTGSVDEGAAFLANYLVQNPTSSYRPGTRGTYYHYFMPRTWDGNANFIALTRQYQSPTTRQYFWITTTLATYGAYGDLDKQLITLVEAPATAAYPANAFTAAAWSGGQVTASTANAHGIIPGQWFQTAGFVPQAYNGWFQAQVGTQGTTLLWNLPSSAPGGPGSVTLEGTLVPSQNASNGVPATEFSLVSGFAHALSYRPSPSNKVAPLNNAFVFGVTPFPLPGNGPLLTSLKQAGVNVIDTGAEGGINLAIFRFGTTMDGRDFTNWYSLDNFALNAKLNLANVIINGSNNPINPLYVDQSGINRLQDAVVATANTEIAVGLALANTPVVRTSLQQLDFQTAINAGAFRGQIVINAIPFAAYYGVNPGDFRIGEYDGISAIYISARGFVHILLNIVASDFVT